MVDESVVRVARNYLRVAEKNGIPVRFGVVFGSHVAGKPHEWSDIDLIVVSPQFDVTLGHRDIDLLWELTVETDSRIEPVPCGERQWEEDDSTPIIEIARRTGERVEI